MDNIFLIIVLMALLASMFFGVMMILNFFRKYKLKKVARNFALSIGITIVAFIGFGLTTPASQSNDNTVNSGSIVSSESDEITKDSDEISKEEEKGDITKPTEENDVSEDTTLNNEVKNTEVEVHFIDTGNSDSILIKYGEKAVLIDGGDNDDETDVVNYIKSVGVKNITYMIATHPHADHIGGLDNVINSLNIENLFVANGSEDTKTYTDFINAAANKKLNPSVPLEGSKFELGSNAYIQIYNTKGGSDTNNQSLVTLFVNGEDKFLFTGDAEFEIEKEILNNMVDIDVLKVGHHGSKTSTSEDFLNKIKPEYAVVLVGEGNKYNHPHKEAMDRLKSRNIEVHRSDECGHVIFKSTGNRVSTECDKASYGYRDGDKANNSTSSSNSTNSSTSSSKPNTTKPSTTTKPNTSTNNNTTSSSKETVYWTPNGKSYHTTKECSTLSRSKVINEGTLAESGKNDPCDRCH